MSTIGYTLVIAGVIFCFLIAILLWRFSYKGGIQQKLLSLIFLIIGWYAFTYLLVAKGWFIYWPFIFRLGMPFYYLVPPFALFYCQLVLKERKVISPRAYFIHGIPFMVALVDLIVYYIKNYDQLDAIMQQILADPVNSYFVGSGFIPASMHYQGRAIQGPIYVVLLGLLFYKVLKSTSTLHIDKTSLRWLSILYSFLAINYFWMFYSTFIQPSSTYPVLDKGMMLALILIICFFVLSIRPFFSPFIIYHDKKEETLDVLHSQHPISTEEVLTVKKILLSAERVLEIASAMDQAMSDQYLFKKLNKIGELGTYLNLSPRYLSYVLSKHYVLNFNDYINSFRINYVIQLMENEQYKHFTLEGLAREAGFSSRTTFFTAFKKQLGVNPTQYLNREV